MPLWVCTFSKRFIFSQTKRLGFDTISHQKENHRRESLSRFQSTPRPEISGSYAFPSRDPTSEKKLSALQQ